MHRKLSFIFAVAVGLLPVWAQCATERTTPVEVTNIPSVNVANTPVVSIGNTASVSVTNTPNVSVTNSPTVKIDVTTNTVKAQQSGTWNVGITGTPGVSVMNTPSVSVMNTPSVNVSSMPGVSISNSPTVKIDDTNNLVTTSSKSKTVMLWTSDQTIAAGATKTSPNIDCRGYSEMRVVMGSVGAAFPARVSLYAKASTVGTCIGTATWATGGIATGSDFAVYGYSCVFSAPVLADTCYLEVANTHTSGSVTMDADKCWVYLTN